LPYIFRCSEIYQNLKREVYITGDQTLSSSLEDYLEAIFHIVKRKGAAKAGDIAKRLSVSSSSVTGALKSLKKRKLVNYAPYDIVTLTWAGERAAQDVIRRHEALRKFLVTLLAVNESEADEEACKMEHVISPTTLERLIQFVRFVETCPAGGAKWLEDKGFVCKYKGILDECTNCEKMNLTEQE